MSKDSDVRTVLERELREIYSNQQGFKVQTSVHLKRVEEFLFTGKNGSNATSSTAKLLLFGFSEEGVQGLFALSGCRGTFGSLKKSSFYALKLVHQLVTHPLTKVVFYPVFKNADEDEFKSIRLATHILEEEDTTVALKLCEIIKKERPSLPERNYILSEEALEKFHVWHEAHKKDSREARLPQASTAFPEELSTPTKPTEEPGISIQTNLSTLQFHDDYIGDADEEYLVDTFVDPLDVMEFKRKNPEERERVAFKQYMEFLVRTPVSQVPRRVILPHIHSIHLESDRFKPIFLLESYHPQLSKDIKHALAKIMPKGLSKKSHTYILRYFFDPICDVERSLVLQHQTFANTERIAREASPLFTLRTRLSQSMARLSEKVEPLDARYKDSEKLRRIITFLETNADFVRLPSCLQALLQQNKMPDLQTQYLRFQSLLNLYRSKPIIRQIVAEIDEVMQKARKHALIELLRSIDPEKVALFLSISPNSENYLASKMVVHLLQIFEGMIPFEPREASLASEISRSTISELSQIASKNTLSEFDKLKVKMEAEDLLRFTSLVRSQEILEEDAEGDLLAQHLRCAGSQNSLSSQLTRLREEFNPKLLRALPLFEDWQDKAEQPFADYILFITCVLEWAKSILARISGFVKALPTSEINAESSAISLNALSTSNIVQMVTHAAIPSLKTSSAQSGHPAKSTKSQAPSRPRLSAAKLNDCEESRASVKSLVLEVAVILKEVTKYHKWQTKEQRGEAERLLRQDSFALYCQVVASEVKAKAWFSATPLKSDPDLEAYNAVLAHNIELILQEHRKLVAHPAFDLALAPVRAALLEFIVHCFDVDESLLSSVPAVLTHIATLHCLAESSYAQALFLRFGAAQLQGHIAEATKKKVRRSEELLFSQIRIEYAATMKSHLRVPFALKILDFLAANLIDVGVYASCLYKKYSRFFLEGFTVEALPVAKEQLKAGNRKFAAELFLVRSLTAKLNCRTVEDRWQAILQDINWTQDEQEANLACVSDLKHRFSLNYSALFDY